MQLWKPEDPQKSSRILEKINLIFVKAVDTFFPKRLLVQSDKHPWIDNEVKNASAKKQRKPGTNIVPKIKLSKT